MDLVALWLLAGSSSWAQTATVTLCAEYQVDYEDSDVLPTHDSDLEGDYFYSNSNKVARGVLLKVVRDDGAVKSKHAAWDGSSAGCATFSLDSTRSFAVRMVSLAEVRGNTIRVRDDPTNAARYVVTAVDQASNTVMSSWSPAAGSSTVHIATQAVHPAWNTAAAAGHAMWRRHGGLANKTFDFFVDGGGCTSGNCMSGGDVHLDALGVDYRFIIVHEMGHAIEYFASNGGGTRDTSADVDDCETPTTNARAHEMISKEWQSTALKEGWAHFYAAVAFNQTTDPQCGFVYYKSTDYIVDASGAHVLSCEQGPNNIFGNPTPATVDAKDFLGDFCAATGSVDGRATELDWLRFWWDLTQENANVGVTDAAEILSVAIDGTWTVPMQGPWIANATSATAALLRPAYRMREAAIFLGHGTEWDAHDNDNGVHR